METPLTLDEEMKARLDEGKVVLLAPQGISMLPFIHGGRDKVMVRKEAEVKVGDIVLVPHGDHLILHRVYAINGARLTLMGDGNLKGTEEVDAKEVMGTAVQVVEPDGRCHKPGKAWLWRHALSLRRYLLKLNRKWNKLWNPSRVAHHEVPSQNK
jgi:hypothetical protein